MTLLHAGARLLLGLLPVLAFLVVLILLDSYKLVRLRTVARLLAVGGAAAVVSLLVNRLVAVALDLTTAQVAWYVAPVTEELLKGAAVVLMIARRRVGFLVDAAIAGFAVGAGFAAIENIHYFVVLEEGGLLTWVVRGFGTAVMHGSVGAIMAILCKQLADRHGVEGWWVYLPGWLLAVALHSAFNHFYLSPNLTTVLLLVVLPVFFVVLFHLSELRTRDWLGVGFDSDAELLELIHSGQVSSSRTGTYLEELKLRFEPTTVADMLCLLRVRLELSIRAKGILLMRQAGFSPEPDPELDAHFAELRYLERSIGATGLLAMAPFFHFSDRDLWQYHMLERR
jgi:RsiW-degrading membrane proteinase PrsW (M82 family)